MSFLRLLSQISVPPIEPRGIDESFLVEQFVDRLKARLAEMQPDLTEDEELDVVAVSPSQSSHLLWKSWAMPIRHSSRLAAGSRGAGGLYVAASSIIDTGLGLDSVDSLRLSKEGGDL
jgi:hypothetical protein